MRVKATVSTNKGSCLQRVDKPSHSLSVLRAGAHECQIRSAPVLVLPRLQRFSITLKRRQRAKIKIILALCQQIKALHEKSLSLLHSFHIKGPARCVRNDSIYKEFVCRLRIPVWLIPYIDTVLQKFSFFFNIFFFI